MRTLKQTFSSRRIILNLKELNNITYVLNFAGVKLHVNQTLLLGMAKYLARRTLNSPTPATSVAPTAP